MTEYKFQDVTDLVKDLPSYDRLLLLLLLYFLPLILSTLALHSFVYTLGNNNSRILRKFSSSVKYINTKGSEIDNSSLEARTFIHFICWMARSFFSSSGRGVISGACYEKDRDLRERRSVPLFLGTGQPSFAHLRRLRLPALPTCCPRQP